MEVGDAEVQSEYLCTLQPFETSALACSLTRKRAACQQAGFLQDSTGLYPPHVSVTGFFKATQKQVVDLCLILTKELAATTAKAKLRKVGVHSAAAEGRPDMIKVNNIVTTDGGHVLLDVVAPKVAELATSVAVQAADIGAHVRPKAVRHLSLASGRNLEEQTGIANIYQDLDISNCGWNLVVSQMLFRSDIETLQRDGTPHKFKDVLRLPIPQATNILLPTTMASLSDLIICPRIGKDALKTENPHAHGDRGGNHPTGGAVIRAQRAACM